MKKVLCLVLGVMMVLSSVTCFAAADATVHNVQNNVYVEGKVEELVQDASLLISIMKDGKVLYISEYELDETSYAIKFKCESDLEGAVLKAKYANEDVTSSVVKATVTSQIMEAEVYVADENDKAFDLSVDTTPAKKVYNEKTVNGVTLPYREYVSEYAPAERSGLKAVVNIKNKFAYEDKVAVMVAAYDENNKLIGCKIENIDVAYGYNGENQALETAAIDVPEGTASAKAFCWNSTTNLIPYGTESDGTLDKVDIFCIGDSFCQDYKDRTWYPESGWGTHLADYFNADYVTVKNYGTSGGWAQAIMSNTNDPKYQQNIAEGKTPTSGMYGWNDWKDMLADSDFSEGDYIIVSLGLNDSSHSGPDGMAAVDWYGMGIEDMVKSAEENGANLILCSAMLRADMKQPSYTQALVDRTEEIAKKYGVPYLAVSDAQAEQYSEEFGYDLNGTYTAAEQEEFVSKIYSKYYLDRDALKDENHEFHLSDEERANHQQSTMYDSHATGRNSHPNLRGADNMARLIAELLKGTESELRFYVK